MLQPKRLFADETNNMAIVDGENKTFFLQYTPEAEFDTLMKEKVLEYPGPVTWLL